jgi:hypothetical protein
MGQRGLIADDFDHAGSTAGFRAASGIDRVLIETTPRPISIARGVVAADDQQNDVSEKLLGSMLR